MNFWSHFNREIQEARKGNPDKSLEKLKLLIDFKINFNVFKVLIVIVIDFLSQSKTLYC